MLPGRSPVQCCVMAANFLVCVCSAIGITVASPTDVVKVRLQAEGRLPAGVPRRYNGALDAYRKIIAADGVAGLWTGYGPNLARNCVVRPTFTAALPHLTIKPHCSLVHCYCRSLFGCSACRVACVFCSCC